MRVGWAILALAVAQAAYAQPPEVPQEVRDIIEQTANEQGLITLGQPYFDEIDDGDEDTVEVTVAPNRITYVMIRGNDDTIAIDVRATAGGKEIVGWTDAEVLQIPAGNGNKVTLDVEMTCEFISCEYFVQAFVR